MSNFKHDFQDFKLFYKSKTFENIKNYYRNYMIFLGWKEKYNSPPTKKFTVIKRNLLKLHKKL